MNRKSQLIKEAQRHIARHNENLDYDTKVLYNQVRALASRLTDEELAKAIQNALPQ
jgi:hypothetical protein